MSAETEKQDTLTRGRTIVYRMLNIRLRSEHEIRDRLRQKNLSDGNIDRTIEYFKQINLIDDQEFARQWISSRLMKPMGPYRIRMELVRKGVKETIIKSELDKLLVNFPVLDTLSELIENRMRRYADVDPVKGRRRTIEFLQRRGFNIAKIMKAMERYDS